MNNQFLYYCATGNITMIHTMLEIEAYTPNAQTANEGFYLASVMCFYDVAEFLYQTFDIDDYCILLRFAQSGCTDQIKWFYPKTDLTKHEKIEVYKGAYLNGYLYIAYWLWKYEYDNGVLAEFNGLYE